MTDEDDRFFHVHIISLRRAGSWGDLVELPLMARILVVDDERDVVELIAFMFTKEGHACICLHDGAQALAELGLEPTDPAKSLPDLVIMDVMMPRVDRYEVCTRMRQDPRTRAVPVLMLTGKGAMSELHQRTPNIAEHLDKPFDPKTLRQLVGAMLEGAR